MSSGFSPDDQFLKLADNSMKYPFVQEKLPYGYDALEPNIDKQTMEIHYSKHHAAYTENFNKAIEANNLKDASLFEIFGMISKLPAAVRNHGGGFYNHLMFWQVMAPNAGGQPVGTLAEAINTEFGAFERFRDKFTDAAKTQFGSGWAWLVVNADGKLVVTKTSNQDNPIDGCSGGQRHSDPLPRCLGACLLFKIPEQAPRLYYCLLECYQLEGSGKKVHRGTECDYEEVKADFSETDIHRYQSGIKNPAQTAI